MSRSTTLTLRQAVNAQETDEVFLLLLTIDHAELGAPIRVVCDKADVTSGGDTYSQFAFQVSLPDDREDRPPRVTLRIDNVDRQIVQAIRTITSAPSVTLEVVLASDPDTIEAGPFDFELRSARYDALLVEGELGFEPVLDEPFPAQRFTPQLYPGLF